MRDLEIVVFKNKNKNVENAALKTEKERKSLENKFKDLLDKNYKLMIPLTRKFPLQGARNLIWDMIIAYSVNLRP